MKLSSLDITLTIIQFINCVVLNVCFPNYDSNTQDKRQLMKKKVTNN